MKLLGRMRSTNCEKMKKKVTWAITVNTCQHPYIARQHRHLARPCFLTFTHHSNEAKASISGNSEPMCIMFFDGE